MTRFANKKAEDDCKAAGQPYDTGDVATSPEAGTDAKRACVGLALEPDSKPLAITQCGKLADDEGEHPGARCISEYSYLKEVERLDADARSLAIQRANALIAHGYQERWALHVAVNLTRLYTSSRMYGERSLPAPGLHLLCEYDAWLLCSEDQGEPSHGFDWFKDALAKAHEIITESGLSLYMYNTDGVIFAKYESYGGDLNSSTMYHLLPHDIGWALKGAGGDEPFKLFDTLKHAEDHARRLAKEASGTLVVHYRRDTAYPPISYQ